MVKRFFDVAAALVALLVLAPIFLLAVIGILLTSKGPVIYRAKRAGRKGEIFIMHKFRTMHIRPAHGSVITGANDSRIFFVGKVLRALKIDELPQLWDVLLGKMSVVGPRPEDPQIVEKFYDKNGRETLEVAPGLASPGSIYNYTHGDNYLDDNDPEGAYVKGLLPIKLALEQVYVRRQSFGYDMVIIWRTVVTIVQIATGKKQFSDPPEMAEARRILESTEKGAEPRV